MPIELLPIGELKALWQQAFEEPMESIDQFFRTGFSPERCRYLLRDGQVVCALYWLDCQWAGKKLAYIYALATRSDHRGKGLAATLLEQTHRHLKGRGYHGAILKPADGLFPYYQRQGYVTCGHIRRDRVQWGSDPLPVKEVSVAQYAALRRQHLPKGGVVQEGASLDFLYTYARLWEGPQCVFCTGRYENAVLEFLGDREALPGVMRALQIPSAEPVCPGGTIPYLMYHPLVQLEEPGPAYLGLALE